MIRSLLLAATAGLIAAPLGAGTPSVPEYPKTYAQDLTETIFGEEVADPYRWLEDDRSLETGEWVKTQNKVTFGYLEKIPYRQELKERPVGFSFMKSQRLGMVQAFDTIKYNFPVYINIFISGG